MVQIISWNDTKELISSDYRRINGAGGIITFVRKLFLDPSFSVTFWLRLGNYFFMRKSLFSRLSLIIIKINLLINQRLTGIQIPIGTQVKGGLRFFHYSCVIIAQSVIIGKNCSIHQGVSIGRVFAGKKKGVPVIGDNVVIFPGAKIIGNIKIGNNVVVGANAVVVDDVSDNCVVAGVPAKVVSKDSSKCFDDNWNKVFCY